MLASQIDRRELLHRVSALMGLALSSSAAAGILAGCTTLSPGDGGLKSFLSPEEMKTVSAMADQIIPRTDTPGAVDAGVPSFIDHMLAGYYQDKERSIIRSGLRAVATDAAELSGKPFADMDSEQQIMLMREYDREAFTARAGADGPHFFRIMKELAILGFCTSEAGATRFLKYAPVPGLWQADIPYSEVGKAWQS